MGVVYIEGDEMSNTQEVKNILLSCNSTIGCVDNYTCCSSCHSDEEEFGYPLSEYYHETEKFCYVLSVCCYCPKPNNKEFKKIIANFKKKE
jgi:hypothetical protein